MYNELLLVQLAPDLPAAEREHVGSQLRDAASRVPNTTGVLCAPTLPGVHNGGDYVWRTSFADETARDDAVASDVWQREIEPVLHDTASVACVEHVAYETGLHGGSPSVGGLYRVALFCANQEPTPARIADFTNELASMALYVRTMRSWQLSSPTLVRGSRPWTHVWEQEYDDLDGLKGSYMLHPCHWAYVDRWFDPEYPEWLIDTQLCHTYCMFSAPVL